MAKYAKSIPWVRGRPSSMKCKKIQSGPSHYLHNAKSYEYVNSGINIRISLFRQNVADTLCCHASRTSHSPETNGITILYTRSSHTCFTFWEYWTMERKSVVSAISYYSPNTHHGPYLDKYLQRGTIAWTNLASICTGLTALSLIVPKGGKNEGSTSSA